MEPYLVCVVASVITNPIRYDYMLHMLESCRHQLRLPDLFVVSIHLQDGICNKKLPSVFTNDLARNGHVRILNQRRPKKQFRQISEVTLRIPAYVEEDLTSRGRPIYVCFADDDDLLAPIRNSGFTSGFAAHNYSNPFTTFKYPYILVTHRPTGRIITCEHVDEAIVHGTVTIVKQCEDKLKAGGFDRVGEIHTTFVTLQALQMFFKDNEDMLDNRFCDQFFLLYLHRQPGSETVWIMLTEDAPWKWAYFYRNDESYPRVTRSDYNDPYELLRVIIDASKVKTLREGTIRPIWKWLRERVPTLGNLPEDAPIDAIVGFATAFTQIQNKTKN